MIGFDPFPYWKKKLGDGHITNFLRSKKLTLLCLCEPRHVPEPFFVKYYSLLGKWNIYKRIERAIDWNMTIFVPFTTETNSMHGSNFRGKQSWSKSMTRPGEPWIPPSKKKMAQGGTLPVIIWFMSHRLVGGWALPLWKMMKWKSVGMIKFPTEWENSPNVPNHQPVESIDISTINQSEIGVIRTNLPNDLGYLAGHVDLCFNTKAPT